jgi:outer membrane protein
MEEAVLTGISGGFEQGKLGTALLGTQVSDSSFIRNGQSQPLESAVEPIATMSSVRRRQWHCLRALWIAFFCAAAAAALPPPAAAQDAPPAMTLGEAVEIGLTSNLQLQGARKEVEAARANRSVQRTNLLPTLSASYQYVYNDKAVQSGGTAVTLQDESVFRTVLTQPLFQGFSLINQYRIADMGVDVAQLSQGLTRLDVIFLIKQAYFNVLKAQKLVTVALDSVNLLEAQVEVARNFYEVGMTPLNDLLQTQVELANQRQTLVTARNDLEVADSQFNILLRRPVDTPVTIVDIRTYTPLEKDKDYYLRLAEKNRLDIRVADLNIQIAESELSVARRTYFPSVSLEGSWFKRGENFTLDNTANILDADGWSVAGVVSWDFWEWGRTAYGEREKISRLAQTRIQKSETLDRARLEIETSYLRAKEFEKNITTVETAIEQAKENMRITEERYKEQAATSTDILVAQNLLNRTQTSYYSALYDFKIAKAFLQKAVNLETLD